MDNIDDLDPVDRCRTVARSVSISSMITSPDWRLIMLVRYCRGSGVV